MTEQLDQVQAEMDHLSLVAKRPPSAKMGREVNIISNSFPVRVPIKEIHVYQISFEPEIPEDASELRRKTFNQRSVREKIETTYGTIFFENTRLWSLRKKDCERSFTNADMTKTIVVRYLKSISLDRISPNDVVQYEQIVHIMLNKVIRASQLVKIGANYFEKNEPLFGGDGKLDIKGEYGSPNIRLWRGYAMSMEQSVDGLQLHCDVVHRVLHQQNVYDLIKSLFIAERKGGNDRDRSETLAMKKAELMLKDNCVLTVYNKRIYRVHSIDWTIGINNKFDKNGTLTSYAEYFKDAYNETCRQEFLGMLVHIPKQRRNAPDRVVLAPELCHMTGLTKKMKSNFTFMRKMADTTRIPAQQRHKLGSKLVTRLSESIGFENALSTNSANSQQKGKGALNRAQMDVNVSKELDGETMIPLMVGDKAVELKGRVLPEAKVLFADPSRNVSSVKPYGEMQSAWGNASFVNKQIVPINKWVILSEDTRLAQQCITHMRNVSNRTGLWGKYLNDSPIVHRVPAARSNNAADNPQAKAWQDAVTTVVDQHKPQLIFCILPDSRRGNPTAVYNKVKTVCCTQNPVLTQCVQSRSITNPKRVMQIMKNVVKQMLTKAGNTPWRVGFELPDQKFDFRKIPTMVCGMDVNHDMRRNVSTVSFCASYSPDYTKYFTFVHHQAAGREVMIDGANLILQALKKFQQANKCLPQQIVIYRDGVSTSQLTKIVMHEVRAYKKAFQTVKIGSKLYSPKLSVIVTQKNVSARFLNSDYKSLLPGTLIDTRVVSAQFWDFYVVPCEAPYKGTASPTRFIVVHDDIGFTQADVAAFTNQMCLLFFNWAGPVRVPAPVQYAHKIAHMFGTAIDQRKPCEVLNGRPFYL